MLERTGTKAELPRGLSRESQLHPTCFVPNVPPISHCRPDAFKLGIRTCGTPHSD